MENTGKPSAPMAGGGAKEKVEKQARQLAYDTRYKVRQALKAKSGGKADPIAVKKAYGHTTCQVTCISCCEDKSKTDVDG